VPSPAFGLSIPWKGRRNKVKSDLEQGALKSQAKQIISFTRLEGSVDSKGTAVKI
jgi:hypothetical protein